MPLPFGALAHPCVVVPLIGEVRDDRRGSRRDLGREGEWVGLLHPKTAAARDRELVGVAGPPATHLCGPDAGLSEAVSGSCPSHQPLRSPTSDTAVAFGAHTAKCTPSSRALRAQPVVEPEVTAFVEQVQVVGRHDCHRRRPPPGSSGDTTSAGGSVSISSNRYALRRAEVVRRVTHPAGSAVRSRATGRPASPSTIAASERAEPRATRGEHGVRLELATGGFTQLAGRAQCLDEAQPAVAARARPTTRRTLRGRVCRAATRARGTCRPGASVRHFELEDPHTEDRVRARARRFVVGRPVPRFSPTIVGAVSGRGDAHGRPLLLGG